MLKKEHLIYNVPLAHRGLHDQENDENSVPAFLLAVNNGLGIELDVHVTHDNQIVVMHDQTTKRTMDGDLVVRNSTYDELKQLTFPNSKTKIPLLKDVLELVNGRVPVLIEVKAENDIPPTLVDEVVRVVNAYPYKETLALQSFNPYVVKGLRQAKTGVIVGQLMSDILPGQSKFIHFVYRSLLVLKISKPDFISYEVEYITKKRIQRKRQRMPLLCWTIDNDEKLKVARDYADNIIFEKIDIKGEK